MSGLRRTELRHRMLAEMSRPGSIYLVCANAKRSLWKPRRNNIGQFNLSAAEARVVNDMLPEYAYTPGWWGNTNALREVQLTEAGRALLAEWTASHGESQP